MKVKDYNKIDWFNYFRLNSDSKSGLSWVKPKYFKGTPNYDRIGSDVGSVLKGKKNNYWVVGIGGVGTFFIHRIIWVMMYGDISSDKDIDHIDGNGLNNSYENLREVSKSENSRNKRKRVDNKTGINGVHYIPQPEPNPKNISDRYGAQFSPKIGIILTKSFSIRKYGEKEAFNLAEDWLKNIKLQYLDSYTERHGQEVE